MLWPIWCNIIQRIIRRLASSTDGGVLERRPVDLVCLEISLLHPLSTNLASFTLLEMMHGSIIGIQLYMFQPRYLMDPNCNTQAITQPNFCFPKHARTDRVTIVLIWCISFCWPILDPKALPQTFQSENDQWTRWRASTHANTDLFIDVFIKNCRSLNSTLRTLAYCRYQISWLSLSINSNKICLPDDRIPQAAGRGTLYKPHGSGRLRPSWSFR